MEQEENAITTETTQEADSEEDDDGGYIEINGKLDAILEGITALSRIVVELAERINGLGGQTTTPTREEPTAPTPTERHPYFRPIW